MADHAAAFEALNVALGISADDFQRTSANPAHAPAVRALWEACARRGDLYRKVYRGRYCVGCERFYEPEELKDGRCPEHDAPLETVEETNWFFRLSRYAGVLREAIESGRLRVVHDGAREETLAFLRGEVRDISVSRSAARARVGARRARRPFAGDLGSTARTRFGTSSSATSGRRATATSAWRGSAGRTTRSSRTASGTWRAASSRWRSR